MSLVYQDNQVINVFILCIIEQNDIVLLLKIISNKKQNITKFNSEIICSPKTYNYWDTIGPYYIQNKSRPS